MGNPTERRRAPKTLTARAKSALACRRHLRDLKEAHETPPADVAVWSSSVPARLAAEPTTSGCTSSAALCAELVR